jgi:hypothetical protein
MEGFTKAMAIELAPHNIRVNSLGPTFLETPMTRPFFENKAFRDEVLGKIKLGRLGQLDEITGAIVFLASDASSLMTGSALVLDGGWTAEYLEHRHVGCGKLRLFPRKRESRSTILAKRWVPAFAGTSGSSVPIQRDRI